jgi:hypothetical protein
MPFCGDLPATVAPASRRLSGFDRVLDAIAREKQLKGWRRSKKIALIQSRNPHWQDLAEKWDGRWRFHESRSPDEEPCRKCLDRPQQLHRGMGCFDSVRLPPHFAQHDRVERIPLLALNARLAAFVLLSHSSLLRAKKCGESGSSPRFGEGRRNQCRLSIHSCDAYPRNALPAYPARLRAESARA